MKEKVRVGIIGLGKRAMSILKWNLSEMSDVDIVAICDICEDRIENARKMLAEKNYHKVDGVTDYRDVVNRPDIDAVCIFTAWRMHTEIAVAAMYAGKYVGLEVGGGHDIADCYKIVDAYEKTGMPCMMLENCCYGRREMMVMNMMKKGLIGEVVHCTGAYMHDLRSTDLSCHGDAHYRPLEYCSRNCDNYPTHAFGPIAKTIGINRGNKMLTLTSVASKAAGLMDYWKRNEEEGSPVLDQKVKQGDIIITNIVCENGELITLTLDTSLPRPYYSRNYSVRGTRGMYEEGRKCVFLDGMEEEIQENEQEFFEKYDHPLHAEYVKLGEKPGHDGMDWLVCRAFIESVKNEMPTPIDAYDTAAWMAITPLSEMSIAQGGVPVSVPDFTHGNWIDREPALKTKYSLDEIVEDLSTPIY